MQNVSGAIRKHLHKNFNVDVHHFIGQPVKDMVQHLAQAAHPASDQSPADAQQDVLQLLQQSVEDRTEVALLLDHQLKILHANPQAREHLQLTQDSSPLLHKHVHPKMQPSFLKRAHALVKGNESSLTFKRLRFAKQANRPADTILSRYQLGDSCYFVAWANLSPTQEVRNTEQTASKDNQFSEVFHASPDAYLILRAADQVVIDFNQGFTQMLGYQREQAIGETLEGLRLFRNTADASAINRQMRAGGVTDTETVLSTANDELIHAEISLRYVQFNDELCILCVGRDITKRISAEAAMVESEEKFEQIFNQSPDAILIMRQEDGVITDINQGSLDRSGLDRSQVVGQSIAEVPFGINPEQMVNIGGELEKKGIVDSQEITLVSEDGKNKTPYLMSAAMLELSGERHVMVMSKDISKQRAAEERVRRSESRFRGIFENAPIGILLVDLHGKIFQANHTAASLLAYDEHHMYGIHVSRLFPADERRQLKEALANLVHRKTSHKSERRLTGQNGMEVWVNFHVALQESNSGKALYYIVQIADISDLKQSQQRMEQMAFYDTLTRLANRRLFHDRLHQAIERSVRASGTSALLYLDLDNFKRVNDTLGHQVGDALLKEVAARLTKCVRKQDTVGRTGGDEFCVLLDDIESPKDAGKVAAKILNHLREPISISGHPLIVTSSIGITIVPTDGMDPNVLMRNADLAMYKAKERGRNNYQYYSEDLNVNAVKRLRTEFEIRQALEQEEFVLYYQPKISVATGEVVGVESLIRWNHPQRGFLGPDEFIGIAEDTGIIIDIGSWVIQAACRAGQQLRKHLGRPLQMAINISPRQFRDPNLVTTMRRSLRETGLDPANVEIEITETMLMQDIEVAHAAVERFAELGVKLAIDDFGTGYSSLNYLKKFPINTVKVDRSFVMDIPSNSDDMAITSAVIAMAHELKMEVVAEGVETHEQFDFLSSHKCEYAQGWLFSKPLPLTDLIQFVVDNNERTKASSEGSR